ncbi:dynamin family protein [Marinobacter sp. TBZ242]|uniref:Dynamin family protein n=1 Tax=Marinobacter azerbaijanicus TaxID=3050455 RepID=A0ABT7IHQ8_9GAMM|nr:dynamin family protein [Marinobacter sp. TBZ242]MDL0433704.1 dynamin family protein [Marinobacter sp. TBZ242]
MQKEQLIQRARKLEEILARNTVILGTEANMLRAEHGVESADALEQAFSSIEEQERLMQVGIIGRVKAGKSSLLNALFFDGKSVLPKAATPMTAALTTMTYGEELLAEVEYYSQDDLEAIRLQAEEYERRFEEERQRQERELLKAEQRRTQEWPAKAGASDIQPPPEIMEKIRVRSLKLARKITQENELLTAAHDQYNRIRNSGVETVGTSTSARLKAKDLKSLKATLGDYVGAEGAYMPFTKSVHLYLPLESLKDIRVIDTPGLNDPIVSRERRTNELLMHCDVVFIVSPAGQCLNATDIDLMGRISTKEGVHELYLVASQVDNVLYGSDTKMADIGDALAKVTCRLGRHVTDTLRQLRQQSPEVGSTFDALIQYPEKRIVNVSGMAHALSQRLDDKINWDSAEQKSWSNLLQHYPAHFSNNLDESVGKQLERLGNISRLSEVLEDARRQKDAIMARRRDDLLRAKTHAMTRYHDAILSQARENQTTLKLTDITQLAAKKSELSTMKTELTERMRSDFESVRLKLVEDMRADLTDTLESLYETATAKQQSAGGTEEYSYEHEKGGLSVVAKFLWGGGTEWRTESRAVVNTAPVASALSHYLTNVSQKLHERARKTRHEWRKNLFQVLVDTYRQTVGDEQVDATLARQTINNVVYSIPVQEFKVDATLPNMLRPRGRLKGTDAESYQEEAERFVTNLKIQLDGSIKNYIANVESSLPADIASTFYKSLDERIERLRHDIENKAESLDRFARLVDDLAEARQA